MARANPVKESRQRELVEATISIIGRLGYANTTLSQVAAAAGLSPGIVNFYFKSKEQLLAATLQHVAAEYDELWQAALKKGLLSPAAGLEAIIEADFHPQIFTKEKVAVWYAFWAEAPYHPAYQSVLHELEGGYWRQTRDLVQRLIQEGGYRGLDADAVAQGFNALIDGLWFDLHIETNDDAQQAKRVCRIYLAAFFPRHFGRVSPDQLVDLAPAEPANLAGAAGDADPQGRAAHRRRFALALRRRLQPAGPVALRDFALQIGVGTDTVQNWLSETTEPSTWLLGKIMAALDPAFLIELYGPAIDQMRQRFDDRLAAERDAAQRDRAALDSFANISRS